MSILVLLMMCLGCGRRDEAVDVEECFELVEAQQFEQATKVCEGAYRRSSDPRAALAAARARRGVGEHEEVLRWTDLLEGTTLEAEGYGVAAGSWRRLGERQEAEQAYVRQLDLYTEARNLEGISGSAYGLFYLAWENSDFRSAQLYARRSLEAAVEADDRSGAARASRAIFSLHYDLGDLERAASSLEDAEAWLDVTDLSGRARHLAMQGAVHLDRGRFQLATSVLLQAIDLAEEDMGHTFFRSNYLNLVKASLEVDDLEAAKRYLSFASQHQDSDDQRPAALLFYRAQVALAEGDIETAEVALEEALRGDPVDDWSWDLHLSMGQARQRSGNVVAATAAYQHSIEILERMRQELGLDELKTWMLEKKRRPYELLFETQASSGDPSAALATLERAKARAFLDAFIRNSYLAEEGPVETLPAGTRQAVLSTLLPSISSSPLVDSRQVNSLLATLGERPALIYFRAEERYWLVHIFDGTVDAEPLDASAAEIDRLVGRFLAQPQDDEVGTQLASLLLPNVALRDGLPSAGSLNDPQRDDSPSAGSLNDPQGDDLPSTGSLNDPQGDDLPSTGSLSVPQRDDLLAAGSLSDPQRDELASAGSLSDPQRDGLPSAGSLSVPRGDDLAISRQANALPWVIVPDGSLSSLPFAALKWRGRYWIEHRPLHYLPSLSALQVIEERPRKTNGTTVVVADPRGDLPAAASEGAEVAELLGVSPFLGAAAGRATLPLARDGGLLHLATHTGLASSGPWLELAEGRLGAEVILDLQLGASVVVLAGCASGAHRSRGLWGSLGATFLASGSNAVVVALWSIDDRATRRFIRRFYEEGGAREPVTALAKTQRAWVAAGEEVTSWAPFVVIGSQERSFAPHLSGEQHVESK